jgi:tight adherence protein B
MSAETVAASGSMVESTAGLGGETWLAVVALLVAAVALWPGGAQGDGLGIDGPSRPSRQGARASPWRRSGRSAREKALESGLAELVAALAAPLRSGVSPVVAIAAAVPTLRDDRTLAPLLRDLSTAAAEGAPVAGVWLRHAVHHGSPDLSFIGRAWALSDLTGAPLADALACAEQTLRSRSRSRERLAAAAAGPRASMAVLCLLPASGPVVGWVMGVDPMTLYFSSSVATASLVVGISLGLAAWGWSRRILRAAS